MRQPSPVIGLFSLCVVLVTAVWIPLTHSSLPSKRANHAALPPPPGLEVIPKPLPISAETPRPVHVRTARELARLFAELEYLWPMEGRTSVPAIEVTALPLDLKRVATAEKKALFLRTLLPLVLIEQNRIREQRQKVLDWIGRGVPATPEIEAIARQYRVKGDLDQAQTREELLRRVDIVPASLALAQAAIESGWGTSRFAVSANNLFGVWTYKRSQGLPPMDTDDDSRHAVRVYPSLRRAVRSYFFNINVGHAYEELRRLRAEMRKKNEPLDPLALAAGLIHYSSRGEAYVEEVRRMIRTNRLHQLGELTLSRADTLTAP
ncbi:MAG: glucosaminidase domain-containing protein [Gammaproteobacteria bacterium]